MTNLIRVALPALIGTILAGTAASQVPAKPHVAVLANRNSTHKTMETAAMLSHTAHIKNYNGLITEEVARQRLRKLGYGAVQTVKQGQLTPTKAGGASQAIGAAPLELTVEKDGTMRRVQIDRVTGEIHEHN
jgi:hypothetical protein